MTAPEKRKTAEELGLAPCVKGHTNWRIRTLASGKITRQCRSCEYEAKREKEREFSLKPDHEKRELLEFKIEYLKDIKCTHGHNDWQVYIATGKIESYCIPCDRVRKARFRGRIKA